MNKYASPGIDGDWNGGVFVSGAGTLGKELPQDNPEDWSSYNRFAGEEQTALIGGFPETYGKTADSMRARNRGLSPFGGGIVKWFRDRLVHATYKTHGITDFNPGADSIEGLGSASSLVRINRGDNTNRGMKLPVLPDASVRISPTGIPSGGQSPAFGVAAPVVNPLPGSYSIVRILAMASGQK